MEVDVEVECRPVGAESWNDVVALFGDNGAYSNCWCTWFLVTSRAFEAAAPHERRRTLEDRIRSGRPSGLLAYRDGQPVGWCAIGPREDYDRLMSPRARSYRSVDDRPTWAVTCFYIPRELRGQGIATALLDAAVAYARQERAGAIDAHPVDLADDAKPSSSLYPGTRDMFLRAGFTEIARHSGRPQVRLEV
jgi:GNAT superfamily N-acetyltransferase